MDLRANAIITAVDRFSGPIGGMAGALNKLRSQASGFGRDASQAYQRVASTASRAVNSVTNPLPSVIALLDKAEEFNKNVFGVGAAVLTDHATKFKDASTGMETVVYDMERVKEVMKGVEDMTRAMSKELGITPTRLSGIAEVLAKAGFEADKLKDATKAVAILSATDLDTPVQRIGEFADVLRTVYKPQDGESFGDFFARQLDIVRIAAAETRLSVGSMMGGLQPFSALYAKAGNSEYNNALMLMAGVKMGGEATEIGHTLKSSAVKFMTMNPESANILSNLGLRRSDYTDLGNLTPMRAAGNLSNSFRAAGIKGNFRKEIEIDIEKAIAKNNLDDPQVFGRIMDKVAKRAGVDMKNENSRAAFEEKFMNAMFGSGLRVDMLKLFKDFIAAGATPAQVSMILERRRIGSLTQILEGLKDYEKPFSDKLGMASKQGLYASQQLYDESSYGRLQRFKSLIEEFQIKLANSEGFEKLLNGLTRFVDLAGQAADKIGVILSKFKSFADDKELNKQTYDASPSLRAIEEANKDKEPIGDFIARKFGEWFGSAPKPVFDVSPDQARALWMQYARTTPASASVPSVPPAQSASGDMVRMMYPTAGPQTVDVTGKVDANVTGQVSGTMQLEATIKVEGGGAVTDQRTSGGEVKGPLNTGTSMPDTKAK